MSLPCPVIFSCAGVTLRTYEEAFFRHIQPFGFMIFRRNCESPEQVRRLVDALKVTSHRTDTPILIDQEGGRVARLQPPWWPRYSASSILGSIALRAPEKANHLAWLQGLSFATVLRPLGVTINCAPVCDLAQQGSHEVIGDRALSRDPELVSQLAEHLCYGMLEGGILPVLKHMPGHGRARCDSHIQRPVVDVSLETLKRTDFQPFYRLSHMPLGMVAHIVYTALDPNRPGSISPLVIDSIRQEIGFDGLLMSDDITMGALSGTPQQRVRDTLLAGCDIALHCDANFEAMKEIAEVVPRITPKTQQRWQKVQAVLQTHWLKPSMKP